MEIKRRVALYALTTPAHTVVKRIFYGLLAVCFLLGGLSGCKKSNEAVSPENGNGGGATEVGVPDGQLVSKVIGVAGGTISSADNQVTLTIPAGALPKDTEIGIQPITNQAPNGLGAAYRFFPDGTTFAKPALLTFSYDPRRVCANSPDAFGVATQGSDRRWQHTPEVMVDTNAHSITTQMPHFSDWTAYELFMIENITFEGENYVELGASVDVELVYANMIHPVGIPYDGENIEVESVKFRVLGGSANGSIVASDQSNPASPRAFYPAKFTAPSKNPPSNPVTVVADVTLKGKKTKLQVVKQILIGKDYFRGVFAETPFDWENLHFMINGNDLSLAGYNEAPSQSLHVLINDVNLAAPNRTYGYADRADKSAWAEFTTHYYGEDGGWLSANADCPSGMRVSPGGVTITQISIVNGTEYIQGHLSGNFYMRPAGCPVALRWFPIQGEFRLKNTFSSGRKPAVMANFKGK